MDDELSNHDKKYSQLLVRQSLSDITRLLPLASEDS